MALYLIPEEAISDMNAKINAAIAAGDLVEADRAEAEQVAIAHLSEYGNLYHTRS